MTSELEEVNVIGLETESEELKELIVELLLDDVDVDNDNGVDKNWSISFTRGRSLTLGQF
jgi:hypothetical protein